MSFYFCSQRILFIYLSDRIKFQVKAGEGEKFLKRGREGGLEIVPVNKNP